MIAPDFGVRVLLWSQPVDFRKGHDGLAALVQTALGRDPFCGDVFVFRSRRADRVKIVLWDGSGLCLIYKRLERGAFHWPSMRDGVVALSAADLSLLLAGVDWSKVRQRPCPKPSAVC